MTRSDADDRAGWIGGLIAPFLTTRFVKFACVGASGVAVNLGTLFLYADLLNLHANVSSALAIETSILSNFMLNEYWTFRDRRINNGGFLRRALRFNVVSLVGALVQWSVFVYANLVWAMLILSPDAFHVWQGAGARCWESWVTRPILSPPEVGGLLYVSQLAGIAAATFWNYLVNVRWTWTTRAPGGRP